MANTLKIDLVTPERRLLSGEASFIALPGDSGEIGILPGHLPLLTTLPPGTLTDTLDNGKDSAKTEVFAVGTGFAEILPNQVTILADTAEPADKIDLERAKAALARAEQALLSAASETLDAERNKADPNAPFDPDASAAAHFRAIHERQMTVERARARIETADTLKKPSAR
jgi:F-type H+-transporting ATPase subunit epsilon